MKKSILKFFALLILSVLLSLDFGALADGIGDLNDEPESIPNNCVEGTPLSECYPWEDQKKCTDWGGDHTTCRAN